MRTSARVSARPGARTLAAALTALLTGVGLLATALPATAADTPSPSTSTSAPSTAPAATDAPTPDTPASDPTPTLPPAPVPVVPSELPEAYDVDATYEGQSQCDPAAKPGALKLAALIKATYGTSQVIGIERGCFVGGQSEHKEGRALDWMTSVRVPAQRANAEAFLAWLMAKDAAGTPYAMAKRLGVMYIGWNDRIWRGYDPSRGWAELKGCLGKNMQVPAQDTYCHRDHIHISLTWDGAAGLTSFWDGTAQSSPYCPRATSSASGPTSTAGLDLVTVSPARVLDTRLGLGTPSGACRLQQDRWKGDNHQLFVKVTGKGQVPSSGVTAVAVRVSAVGSNAPSYLRVWPAGTSPVDAPVLSVAMNSNATAATVVPVGSDGTIGISTRAGATDVVVDVLGYLRPAPAGALPAGGALHVPRPTKVFDTAAEGGDLQPGESRTVSLAGRGGIPASAGSLILSVTPYGSATAGGVKISRPGERLTSRTLSVYAPAGSPRTGRIVTPAGPDASLVLTNAGKSPVKVKMDLIGWAGPDRDSAGGSLVPVPMARVIDTANGVGISGALARKRPETVRLAGAGGVPEGARAVALQVTTTGGTRNGAVTAWPAGTSSPGIRSVGVVKQATSTELLVVPLGADGAVSWISPSTSVHLRAYVVGYLA
ncbi:MAG: hypothetical protein R2737_13495 [Candidatus Nanopelagicales bacterium]